MLFVNVGTVTRYTLTNAHQLTEKEPQTRRFKSVLND